jgi:transposase
LYRFDGYVVEKVVVEEVGVQVKMRFDSRRRPCCPRCAGGLSVHRKGVGLAADLPLADRLVVWVTFPVVQGKCGACDSFVTTRPAEVHPSRKATWRWMRCVSSWAAACPISAVAERFRISEATVRRYDQAVLEHDLPEPCLDGIDALLVDEKSVRKGHGYVTVVINARTGELLHMDEGKKKESLVSFFDKLTMEQKSSIKAVCIDRNGAYRSAIEEQIPQAEIVHDRFHLIMNLNAAVDEIRRAEWRKANKEDRRVIKGNRFLILAGRENLSGDGKRRLDALVALNTNLTNAYLLKEDFRSIYQAARTPKDAEMRLRDWVAAAVASGLQRISLFARILLKSKDCFTAYFKHRITSGPIEAFNNQIARLIHRSCGVSNLDYLFLKMRAQSLQQN